LPCPLSASALQNVHIPSERPKTCPSVPLLHYWTGVETDKKEAHMSKFLHTVADFIRVSTKPLEAKDLSDDEEDSVRDILWQLCDKFPDEGDDATD
jgi:hypothetical protein